MAQASGKPAPKGKEEEWKWVEVGGVVRDGMNKGEQVDRRALAKWKRRLLFFS